MTKRANIASYSTGSKVFHWFIAAAIISMLGGSFFLDDLPKQYQSVSFLVHKSIGITILFLMIARFLWIQHSGKPVLPLTVPIWQKYLSRVVQYSLYVFVICQATCGWIMSVAAERIPSYFGLFSLPLPIEPNKELSKLMNQTHEVIAWILIVLVVLHIGGALKHHYIDKDDVLKRMLPNH